MNRDKFDDRIRFNWGFWDAHADRSWPRSPRILVMHGPHDILHVSREADPAYFDGYNAGLEAPLSSTSSEPAWAARAAEGV